MSKDYFIKVVTYTPLWTGDAKRQCNDIKSSGITGSIRWWYEKVLESQGYNVCAPTLSSKCKFEVNYEEIEKALEGGNSIEEELYRQMAKVNICPICRLFGCTGWGGKLRIHTDSYGKENKVKHIVKVGTRCSDPNASRRVEGMMFNEFNPLKIYFYPLKDITAEEWKFLNYTLKTISNYGALGGRTAQGNGLVEIVYSNLPYSNENFDIKDFKYGEFKDFFSHNFFIQFKSDIVDYIDSGLFWKEQMETNRQSLGEAWERLWDDYGILPIAFHVRDTIRRSIINESDRHNIFGEMGKGSHIFVSHGIKKNESKVAFRVWGYGLERKTSEHEIRKAIFQNLTKYLFS